MTYPIIKTDNYILITSDEEIKSLDAEWSGWWHGGKKVIAHLPLNNSLIHKGVPLLPPLPDEEDVDKLAEKEITFVEGSSDIKGMIISAERGGFVKGFLKAKEKYNITPDKILDLYIEETGYGMDMWSKEENATMLVISKIIDSLSQPKIPVGFKCEMVEFEVDMGLGEECIEYGNYPKIFKGVMQGEWIFEI